MRHRQLPVTFYLILAAWLLGFGTLPPVTPAKGQTPAAQSGPKETDLVRILHNLHDRFPNLKMAYLSSRTYGGYAASPSNQEPHAYESGFAVKWVISRQISVDAELTFDPAKGPVRSPWIAWGSYLWADGHKGRSDGFVWRREDFGPDSTHPSPAGQQKVARLLLAFLKREPTSRSWFLAQGAGATDMQRIREIRAKRDRGEELTPEERQFVQAMMARQKSAPRVDQEWVKNHPPRDSVGLVPLCDQGRRSTTQDRRRDAEASAGVVDQGNLSAPTSHCVPGGGPET
jgi:hypothetical protein